MLLSNLTLIELKNYPGRRRNYVKGTTSVFQNVGNSVSYEDITFENCSLQPMDKATMQLLPEGYRTLARYQGWTTTPLQGLEQNSSKLPDQILIEDWWYSMINMEDWGRTSFLGHNHFVAVREDINNSVEQNPGGGNFG